MEEFETALKNFVQAHAEIPLPSTPNSTQRGQKRRADGSQTTPSSAPSNAIPQMKRDLAKELYGGKEDGELA